VAAEIVHDDDVARPQGRKEHLLDISQERPLIGPSITHRASMRSQRKAARLAPSI
jgi:hypothetical protein